MTTQYDSAWALGLGPQADQATTNPNVLDITADLQTTPVPTAGGSPGATGILVRDPADISQAFNRIESDGGTLPGSLSRISGSLQRIEPVLSFEIDAMGGQTPFGNPAATGDFNFMEYMEQILAGTRLSAIQENLTISVYSLENDPTQLYKTLKVWSKRGAGAVGEAWVFSGCTFGITWNLTAGEKVPMSIEVFADSVIYQQNATFPQATIATAYGDQVNAPPLLERASATLNSLDRGFQSGTISIGYESEDFQDCNAVGGIVNSQGTRNIIADLDWIAITEDDDFPKLEQDSFATGECTIDFAIGQPTAPILNAMGLTILHLRYTAETKVDSTKTVRKITGYASLGDDALTDGTEFQIYAV